MSFLFLEVKPIESDRFKLYQRYINSFTGHSFRGYVPFFVFDTLPSLLSGSLVFHKNSCALCRMQRHKLSSKVQKCLKRQNRAF